MRTRIVNFWVLVVLAFLVVLLMLAVFFLSPPLRKPVPGTPPKYWDVPTWMIPALGGSENAH
ncbi:hypothetical protein SY88_11250 [Clostridiales bacterium PH28_bin88]|nr:hypothetical protein SY88_11250 [Clostridiales bacterium PH28_bin88]